MSTLRPTRELLAVWQMEAALKSAPRLAEYLELVMERREGFKIFNAMSTGGGNCDACAQPVRFVGRQAEPGLPRAMEICQTCDRWIDKRLLKALTNKSFSV